MLRFFISTLAAVFVLEGTTSVAVVDPDTAISTAQSIPEPTVIKLLLFGLVGFVFRRR